MKKKKWQLHKGIVLAVLTIWALGQVVPLLWLVNASLKSSANIQRYPLRITSEFHWQNYYEAWTGHSTGISIGVYFKNSVIVVVSSLLILTLVSTLAAYAFARFRFRGKRVFIAAVIGLIAVPAHAIAIPMYQQLQAMGLINNCLGLIAVYSTINIPFSVIILQSYFQGFPQALEEAAMIDGASRFTAFLSIALPIARGAVAAITVVNFIGLWSELLYSMIIVWQDSVRTIPAGILSFNGQWGNTEWGYLYAAISISTVPMILFYLLFRKFILKGMSLGAVK